jgi:hypothetical protein
MNHKNTLYFVLFLGGSILIFLGCTAQKLSNLVPVDGTVTYNGTPVDGANVMFIPVNSETEIRPAIGTTDVNGHFKMRTLEPDDGVTPGDFNVIVTKNRDTTPPITPPTPSTTVKNSNKKVENEGKGPSSRSPDAIQHLLPKKYAVASTSGLKITVTKSGNTGVVFELTD